MKSTQLFLVFVFILFSVSCTQDGSEINPIKTNQIVTRVLNNAGITTFDCGTPPQIDGVYSTTNMTCTDGSSVFTTMIGSRMTTNVKFFNQSSEGKISVSEQISPNVFASGNGAFITGCDNNFTIWMQSTLSNGAETAFVLSGTKDTKTGNLVNCKSVTIYTKATPSIPAGEWYNDNGILVTLNPLDQCDCFKYHLGGAATLNTETSKKYFISLIGYPNGTSCQSGTITYTFSNSIQSKTIDLQSKPGLGYCEVTVPVNETTFTVNALIKLSNGNSCELSMIVNNLSTNN